MADRHWFERAFGGGVADIRQKLIEEGWFGRTVTPRPLAQRDDAHDGKSLWERLGWGSPAADRLQSPTSQELDRGIDR